MKWFSNMDREVSEVKLASSKFETQRITHKEKEACFVVVFLLL